MWRTKSSYTVELHQRSRLQYASCVIGLPDEKWGEVACAVVVGDPAEASEEAILKLCAEKLSRYKLPKRVEYADALPRNPAGKVLKRVLREQFA